MKQEWFRWERESSIQSMFPCLKAWFKPMREYIGFNWPDSVLIWNEKIVAWCLRPEPTYNFGQRLIDYYSVESNLEDLKRDIGRQAEKLNLLSNSMDESDLKRLDNNQLLSLYNSLIGEYVEWYKIGGSTEPIDMSGEKTLKEKLEALGEDPKMLSALTVISKESFAREQEKDFLKIATKIKSEKRLEEFPDEIKKLLDAHARKWFWIKNNFLATTVLDTRFFVGEMKKTLSEIDDPAGRLSELEKKFEKSLREKQELLEKIKLDGNGRKLISLLDFFGWFQDYRKKYVLMILHYLDALLTEASDRSGLSLAELKFTFPEEIAPILNNNFSRDEIGKRIRNCMVIWRQNADNYEYYVGEGALEKEKEVFGAETKPAEITEIIGSPAQRGKVRGIAFVTAKAEEIKDMKQGQILVTPMTSPDFIIAIKKASAIVTDWGGILCHAAIVSREFGIPCVVGTNVATKVIKTGDLIEVDANEGIVRKILN